MEEEKIKEILEEGPQQQVKQTQKKGFWNNKRTVKGKALSAWLIVIITIFMLFIFGLGIYLGKEVFTEKESNPKNNNQAKTSIHDLKDGIIDINSEEAKEYIDMYAEKDYLKSDDLNNLKKGSTATQKNIDLSKLRLAFLQVKENEYNTVKCSEVSITSESGFCGGYSEEINEAISENNQDTVKEAIKNNIAKSISKETLERYYKKYFGSNAQIVSDFFSESESVAYKYDSKLNAYVQFTYSGGGTGPYMMDTVKKMEKDGDYLTIYYSVLVEDTNSPYDVTQTLKWDCNLNRYVFYERV